MANLYTDDFTLTIPVGYSNMKALIVAAAASILVPTYKWSMLAITNTGANPCTLRRTPKSDETTASTTNGRNIAAGSGIVLDARHCSEIDGSGIWFYSAGGTTVDVSISRSGK